MLETLRPAVVRHMLASPCREPSVFVRITEVPACLYRPSPDFLLPKEERETRGGEGGGGGEGERGI